MSTEHFFCQVT